MQDRYGHRISYLRVSITDRCNERCTYCMPQELQEWLPREEILTFEETLRLIRVAADLGVLELSTSRRASGSPAATSTFRTPRSAATRISRSVSSKVRISSRGNHSCNSCGMQ